MPLFLIRILQMVKKEFIQALRDPRMRLLIFLPPVVQLLAFGYAANLDLKNIPTAVFDQDNSAVSRELISRFSSSGYFSIKKRIDNQREMNRIIDHGQVKAVLRFAPSLAKDVKSGKTAAVQIIVSGTDSNTASKVIGYAAQIIEGYNRDLLKQRFDRNPAMALVLPAGPNPLVEARIRVWYNQDLSSVNFYVPGIIALIIMLVVLILTSMSVVREKEIGTMEQIMVTPIKPVEFILGKTVPFGLIGLIQVSLVTSIGVLWFKVPMRGSLLFLGLTLSIYLLSALALGLLISTISRTQQQALLTTFFFLFPALLLSGFIFPIANMPKIIQLVTYINPLRYALVAIRGIFLRGAGFWTLWPQLLALAILGFGLMSLAVIRLNKKLE